ncbi:MAG TPA: co-chaperone GroES [Candidatus Cloacimonadota bacterium]|nr:co-chaperone GroES [Candidatus Cloacimonadota bacterium]
MRLKHIDDHLVIQIKADAGEKQIGGIYIPDTAKEKPQIAEVIAVGNNEELQKIIKVGDKVLFGKYAGTEVELDGNKYIILSQSDVLAIVEG